MKAFLTRFFTWWNGETFGTQLWTWLHGEFVGEDEFGNRYYRTKGGKIDPTLGFQRRWVIYNGVADASSIPPSWHGWMHHTVDVPPTEEKVQARPWWKPHRPNLDRHPRSAPADRLDPGAGPAAEGDRRLQGLDPGAVSRVAKPLTMPSQSAGKSGDSPPAALSLPYSRCLPAMSGGRDLRRFSWLALTEWFDRYT